MSESQQDYIRQLSERNIDLQAEIERRKIAWDDNFHLNREISIKNADTIAQLQEQSAEDADTIIKLTKKYVELQEQLSKNELLVSLKNQRIALFEEQLRVRDTATEPPTEEEGDGHGVVIAWNQAGYAGLQMWSYIYGYCDTYPHWLPLPPTRATQGDRAVSDATIYWESIAADLLVAALTDGLPTDVKEALGDGAAYVETQGKCIAELEAELQMCKEHGYGWMASSNTFRAERDALVEAARWIPVSERLPDNGVNVLGALKSSTDKYTMCRIEYSDKHTDHDWSADGFEVSNCWTVTHWMPLPEPPPIPDTCEHNWVNAENEVCKGGEMCTKCHTIRPIPQESGE